MCEEKAKSLTQEAVDARLWAERVDDIVQGLLGNDEILARTICGITVHDWQKLECVLKRYVGEEVGACKEGVAKCCTTCGEQCVCCAGELTDTEEMKDRAALLGEALLNRSGYEGQVRNG